MKNKIGLDGKGRMTMWLTLPLPPSDNQLYENLPGRPRPGKGGKTIIVVGGRRLSKKGEAYKKAVQDKVGELAAVCPDFLLENVKYTLVVKVFFEAIENKGWPGKAKSRYKKIDTMNRTKLPTDAVAEMIGVDDRHHFLTIVQKECDPEDPRIEMILREQEPRDGEEAESLL